LKLQFRTSLWLQLCLTKNYADFCLIFFFLANEVLTKIPVLEGFDCKFGRVEVFLECIIQEQQRAATNTSLQ